MVGGGRSRRSGHTDRIAECRHVPARVAYLHPGRTLSVCWCSTPRCMITGTHACEDRLPVSYPSDGAVSVRRKGLIATDQARRWRRMPCLRYARARRRRRHQDQLRTAPPRSTANPGTPTRFASLVRSCNGPTVFCGVATATSVPVDVRTGDGGGRTSSGPVIWWIQSLSRRALDRSWRLTACVPGVTSRVRVVHLWASRWRGRRPAAGHRPPDEPDRVQAFTGGSGGDSNRIDKRKALAGISAGQGLTVVGVAGFEPTTSSSRH